MLSGHTSPCLHLTLFLMGGYIFHCSQAMLKNSPTRRTPGHITWLLHDRISYITAFLRCWGQSKAGTPRDKGVHESRTQRCNRQGEEPCKEAHGHLRPVDSPELPIAQPHSHCGTHNALSACNRHAQEGGSDDCKGGAQLDGKSP